MTYDYADWFDEDYGDGDTAVTLSLQAAPTSRMPHASDCDDDEHGVMFVLEALGGDVKLVFTLAPQDVLDALIRIVGYGHVDVNELHVALDREVDHQSRA